MAPVVRRPVVSALVAVAFALVAVGWPSGAGAAATQAPPLTEAAEPAALLAAPLAPEHADWLQEVAPLLGEEEREAFLGLAADHQRNAFIEAFWRSRDPFPETARNELREPWEERVAEARQRFDDLADDRSRFYLLLGEPAAVFAGRCAVLLRPLEVWRYRGSSPGGSGFYVLFTLERGRYRAWDPRSGLSSLVADPGRPGGGTLIDRVAAECADGQRLVAALTRTLDWGSLEEAGQLPVRPSGEWLQTFLATTTVLPREAEALAADLTLSFPGARGGRTMVQGVIEVPRGDATLATDQGAAHDFVVDGEVLRRGERFETFRYRFRVPAATGGETLPLVFQRPLRPGAYRLLLRVREVAADRWFRDERDLEVPFLRPGEESVVEGVEVAGETGPAGGERAADRSAPALSSVADPVAEANRTLGLAEHTIRLLPAPATLTLGKVRVEAVTTGDGVDRVRFLLDGREAMRKSRPPWSVELDLGGDLRTHRLTAVALDAAGEELARDHLVLNAGPHRFAVRLVEPQPTRRYQTSLRVAAEVEVPEGEILERVEIYLDDVLQATLYQPPYVQPVRLLSVGEPTYVRAVALLADGISVEDVVFVNAPDHFEAVDVHTVELYTTVVDRQGRPVAGLTRDDFRVREEGVEQVLRRFERVDDLSIYAGVLLDTSGSMAEVMPEALAAASRFFDTVVGPRDRAAVITFDDRPHLAVRFTGHPEVLAGGLAGTAASGGTALWDSLVFTLHYFSGVQGKRAVVLLSDGDDQASRYSFTEVLDYARRTGVAVYPIGLGPDASRPLVRSHLVRLAAETGGRAFFVDRARQLEKVYEAIEQELRSQYLLVYQSSLDDAGDDFRRVEVEVARPGLEAKTIRGYYP